MIKTRRGDRWGTFRQLAHYPGCWRFAGHRRCAVTAIEELIKDLEEILDEARGDCDRDIIITGCERALARVRET